MRKGQTSYMLSDTQQVLSGFGYQLLPWKEDKYKNCDAISPAKQLLIVLK
jgi:hypothetical protein